MGTPAEGQELRFSLNLRKMRRRFNMDFVDFRKEPNATLFQVEGHELTDRFIFINNGPEAKILAVAHLDTVNASDHFVHGFFEGRERVFSQRVDDRLGAYYILDLLPEILGSMPYDVLLTWGEETGNSTAALFDLDAVKPGHEYHWIFECDRREHQCVGYNYQDADNWRAPVVAAGWEVGHGSFTDICKLYKFGKLGFNFGTGYHDEHAKYAYVDLAEAHECVIHIARFIQQNVGVDMPYIPKPYTAPANSRGWSGEGYETRGVGRMINGVWVANPPPETRVQPRNSTVVGRGYRPKCINCHAKVARPGMYLCWACSDQIRHEGSEEAKADPVFDVIERQCLDCRRTFFTTHPKQRYCEACVIELEAAAVEDSDCAVLEDFVDRCESCLNLFVSQNDSDHICPDCLKLFVEYVAHQSDKIETVDAEIEELPATAKLPFDEPPAEDDATQPLPPVRLLAKGEAASAEPPFQAGSSEGSQRQDTPVGTVSLAPGKETQRHVSTCSSCGQTRFLDANGVCESCGSFGLYGY